MGKVIKKVHKAISGITGSDKLLGDAGLPNLGGRNTARENAEKEAAATRAAAQREAEALRAMQSNFAADLKGENLSNVIAGGTASMSGTDPLQKKRKGTSGLSSTLGIV